MQGCRDKPEARRAERTRMVGCPPRGCSTGCSRMCGSWAAAEADGRRCQVARSPEGVASGRRSRWERRRWGLRLGPELLTEQRIRRQGIHVATRDAHHVPATREAPGRQLGQRRSHRPICGCLQLQRAGWGLLRAATRSSRFLGSGAMSISSSRRSVLRCDGGAVTRCVSSGESTLRLESPNRAHRSISTTSPRAVATWPTCGPTTTASTSRSNFKSCTEPPWSRR